MKHLHLTSFVLLTFLLISAIKPPLHVQERKNLIHDYDFEVDNLTQ